MELTRSISGRTPWDRGGTTLDMLGLLLDAPNMPRAACVGRHGIYDDAAAGDPAAQDQAREICRQCPHLAACAQWCQTVLTDKQRADMGCVAGQVYVNAKPQRQPKAKPQPQPRHTAVQNRPQCTRASKADRQHQRRQIEAQRQARREARTARAARAS